MAHQDDDDDDDDEEEVVDSMDEEKEEEDESTIRCRQLFLLALDSAVVSSGLLNKRETYSLSQVCQGLCSIVRQRVKEISGGPLLLSQINHFPGARGLTVSFSEPFSSASEGSVSYKRMTWSVPSTITASGNIGISQIQSLTIKASLPYYCSYTTEYWPFKHDTGSAGSKKGKKKAPEIRHVEIEDPFGFMLPFIPHGLASLSLIVSGVPSQRSLLVGISQVMIQPFLSSLQHLKIEYETKRMDDLASLVWPVIEQGKIPHLQSLYLKGMTIPGLQHNVSSTVICKLLLGLGSRQYLPALRSVVLWGTLGLDGAGESPFTCLIAGSGLDLSRINRFYVSDLPAVNCLHQLLSVDDRTWDLQSFGAKLICSLEAELGAAGE